MTIKEQTIAAMARAIEMARATIERDIPAGQRGHVQATASALATAAYTVVKERIERLEGVIEAALNDATLPAGVSFHSKRIAIPARHFHAMRAALTHKDVAP